MISIRGAITVNEDVKNEIISETKKLLESMIKQNELNIKDIISVIFSCTRDIESVYPAVAARELGILDAGLMCFNEMYVKDSLTKCIRVMILAAKDIPQSEAVHVYLGGARVLRPDLI